MDLFLSSRTISVLALISVHIILMFVYVGFLFFWVSGRYAYAVHLVVCTSWVVRRVSEFVVVTLMLIYH